MNNIDTKTNNTTGSSNPIGVFDSGIGGLTVVRSLMAKLPNESIVYFGDTARVPYGPKSSKVVRTYAEQDTEILLRQNVKMIVIACNTVSAVALDVVTTLSTVPVIGVIEPAAKVAAAATRSGNIGVIGTIGTIASNAYLQSIRLFNSNAVITPQPCPLFVPLAEEGWENHDAAKLIAREYLNPLLSKRIDTLLLGCTHYPILKAVLEEVVGENVKLVDSADSTADDVATLLTTRNLTRKEQSPPEYIFLVSDLPHRFKEIGERFLGRKLENIELVSAI